MNTPTPGRIIRTAAYVATLYLAMTAIIWLFQQNPMMLTPWQLSAWLLAYAVACYVCVLMIGTIYVVWTAKL